jgi:hypothetical protein
MNGIRSPVSARVGGGAAHVDRARLSPQRTEPERTSNQGGRLGGYGLCALVRSQRSVSVIAKHHRQAYPRLVQLGVRLIRPAPF